MSELGTSPHSHLALQISSCTNISGLPDIVDVFPHSKVRVKSARSRRPISIREVDVQRSLMSLNYRICHTRPIPMFEGTAMSLTYRGSRGGGQHIYSRPGVIQHDGQRVTNMSETIYLHLVRIRTTRVDRSNYYSSELSSSIALLALDSAHSLQSGRRNTLRSLPGE